MLTVDTITDAQIRALAREALTASQHKDCAIALQARREMLTLVAGKLARTYPTTRQRRAARARCAEILNARAVAGCHGRRHRNHAAVTCSGSCCTECGGPIDENEECRC